MCLRTYNRLGKQSYQLARQWRPGYQPGIRLLLFCLGPQAPAVAVRHWEMVGREEGREVVAHPEAAVCASHAALQANRPQKVTAARLASSCGRRPSGLAAAAWAAARPKPLPRAAAVHGDESLQKLKLLLRQKAS